MKWIAMLWIFFLLHTSCLILPAKAQGNVGIGTTSPNASALLDLTSLQAKALREAVQRRREALRGVTHRGRQPISSARG